MLSISLISLPPETLQRMASQRPLGSPGGRRWERTTALIVACGVAALLTAVIVLA